MSNSLTTLLSSLIGGGSGVVQNYKTGTDSRLANTYVFFQANGNDGRKAIKDQQEAYKLAYNAMISGNNEQASFMLQLASLSNTDFAKISALSNDNGLSEPNDAPLKGISVYDLLNLSQKGATSNGLVIAKDDFTAAGVTTVDKTYTKAQTKALAEGTAPAPTPAAGDLSEILKLLLPLLLLGGLGGGQAGGQGGIGSILLLLLLSGKLGASKA